MGKWLKRYGSLFLTVIILGAAVIVLIFPNQEPASVDETPPTPPDLEIEEEEEAPAPTMEPAVATPRPDQLEPVLAKAVINQPGMLVRQPDPYTFFPTRERRTVREYTVQQGDTLNVIAANFELDPKTLFWGNPDTLTNVHMLSVGMDLNILPVDGVLHVSDGKMTVAQIAQEYEVEPFDILDSPYNSLYAFMPEDYVPKGERVVVPGGQGDETDWVWNPEVAYSGDSSSSGSSTAGKVRFSPSDPGSCGWQEIAYGTGAFSNPIPSGGYTITQWFSAWHSGIDLAGTTGTPVVASDGGRVIFAGWNNFGFGNLVVIVHGATMSFYGHLNGISVRCGQVISAGTQVGTMGNTGRSSGPHLHFEIRYNDIPTDPALYTTF